jgi:cysteine synthase
LGCQAVGILPEEMSRERFEWLEEIGAEVIATPGCESNVKEIFDKCWEIRRTRPDCVIFNQFEEFGNAVWHYHTTGTMIEEIFERITDPGDRLAAYVSATGSGGTIAAGDFLRTRHPPVRVTAVEALQCPTLLMCGFGGHRIEGIGDKHVPWIHNVRNTDLVAAIDDQQCLAIMRLLNEPAGRELLASEGVDQAVIKRLPLLGISGICNLVAAIKTAKHFEFGPRDVVFTCLTDSMQLYQSRLDDERARSGGYDAATAARQFGRYLEAIATDNLRELTYRDRKAIHNLKYFTWVEQQARSVDELHRLWDPDFWTETFAQVEEWDRLIDALNDQTGVASAL